MNFWAMKFISFVPFEQLKSPTPLPPFRAVAVRRPAAARSRASRHEASRSWPLTRTRGLVSRTCPFFMAPIIAPRDFRVRAPARQGGTIFGMRRYDPSEIEPRWEAAWEQTGAFWAADEDD